MADGIDLYADFDFAPPTVSSAPSQPCSMTAATPGSTRSRSPAAKEKEWGIDAELDLYGDLEAPVSVAVDDGEGEDNEAVSALLELLCAAEDQVDDDAAGGVPSGATVDRGSPERAFLLSMDSLDSDQPQKSRRLNAEREGPSSVGSAPPMGAAAPAGDSAFDFEADLTPTGDRTQICPLAPKRGSGPGPPSSAASTPSKYWYNPETKRWEQGQQPPQQAARTEQQWWSRGAANRGIMGARGQASASCRAQPGTSAGRARGSGYVHPAPARLKKYPCRHFAVGKCRWGDECYFSHAEDAMQRYQMNPELVKRHHIAQCAMEARTDAAQGVCEYPQALAVRLALRFEERPEDMLAGMAQAGLPAGSDQRTTVKALLRLCHPDKCRHPDAKKAAAVLGPLLGKAA